LLNIGSRDDLLAHPVVGASWEGFAVENILQAVPEGVVGYYYRTGGGAEVDLLLVFPGGEKWAVEIKRGPNPRPERGFYEACVDLEPTRRLVVYPGSERYPLSKEVEAVSLPGLCAELQSGKA
jgi:predicted AAA+ superfamily ATPase